ncbi:MAG: VPLPA-CTERM sorting domain-containing protein [Pseudomonadota bacterium]
MKKLLQVAAAAALSLVASAQATVISGSVTGGGALTNGGTFVKLTVPFTTNDPAQPNTVGDDNFNTFNLYAFDEEQNVLATSLIEVDEGSDIPMGSTVASHYVFFDPPGFGTTSIQGTVTFDSAIRGVVTTRAKLNASDPFANTGVTYLSDSLRGLESNDSVSFSGNTLTIDFRASSPGDYVRVFTDFSPGAVDPIPVPAAAWLMGAGLAGLFGVRRRAR